MSATAVLTCEEGSALFSHRVITLPSSAQVRVGRETTEEHPGENNCVFNCKVLSRDQAVFSFVNGNIYLKDTSSRNGSFVNGVRLSKPFQESEATRLYSQDILRFGTQARDQAKDVKERCIVAKVRLFSPSGAELGTRPAGERFSKPITEDKTQDTFIPKQNHVENINSNTENSKHQTLNGESEIKSEQTKIGQKQYALEIDELKRKLEFTEMEFKKQIQKLQVRETEQIMQLQMELEERQKLLKKTFNENMQLQIQSKIENETIKNKDVKIENLTNEIRKLEKEVNDEDLKQNENISKLENEIKEYKEEVRYQKQDLTKFNDLLIQANESSKEKETEIVRLTDLLNKDQTEKKEKDVSYQELETLITEEDETLQEVEIEMRRLLDVIAEDQETILSKDKEILDLKNLLQEKDDLIQAECSGMTKQEMEISFLKTLNEKQSEIKLAEEERESSINKLREELEEQEKKSFEKDLEIEALKIKIENQTDGLRTHEALKAKCEELMNIIIKQNSELERVKNNVSNTEMFSSRNDILQKEIFVYKVAIQQKDSDIKTLNDLLAMKEKSIEESDYIRKSTTTENQEEIIKNLQQKIVNEQEINDQAEQEIIQLKMKLDDLEKEFEEGKKYDLPKNDQIDLLNLKDAEIVKLKSEIQKEQQIIAHVQVTQEKEILQKEQDIVVLNDIIKKEREEGFENKKEKDHSQGLELQDGSVDELLDKSVTETLDGEDTIQEDFSDDEDFDLVNDLEADEEHRKDNEM